MKRKAILSIIIIVILGSITALAIHAIMSPAVGEFKNVGI